MNEREPMTYRELADMLNTHAWLTDPDHPHYTDSPEDKITPKDLHDLWKRLKLRGIKRDEFYKAVSMFMTRDHLYNPLRFIEQNGFNQKGECIINKGFTEKKKKDWHMAEPHRATPEQRMAYYQHYKVSAVDENLNYIIINGNVVR